MGSVDEAVVVGHQVTARNVSDIDTQLKYIAVYRVVPTQAITHYAPIRSIEPWKDEPGKVVVSFTEPAKQIGPLALVRNGKVKPLMGLRYTTFEKLRKASSFDDAF